MGRLQSDWQRLTNLLDLCGEILGSEKNPKKKKIFQASAVYLTGDTLVVVRRDLTAFGGGQHGD